MEVSKNITINGAGKVLTDNGAIVTNGFSIKITAGEVTVKNITLKRDNKKSYAFFWLPSDTGGVLTLSDDVIFDSVNGGNGSAAFLEGNEGCKLNVTGSNVVLKDCDGAYGVIALLNNSRAEISNITMTYSKTGSNRNGIGVFHRSQLTMNAGMISGYMNGVAVGTNGWGNSSSNVSVSNLGKDVSIQSCGTAGIALGAAGTVNTSASISGCKYPINISGAGTININGGEITGTQKVINATGGTVNVKAGTVTGTANVIAVEGGSVNVSGGEITGTNGTGINAIKGSVNITGGTLSATGSSIYAGGATVVLDGGTIKDSTRGISAASGTVEVKSGAISGCTTGINAGGATVTVSGGTITGCKYGIEGKSGTVSMTDGTIENCRGASGDPGSGIRVYKDGTLSVNVSGGTITKNENGLQLVGNGDTATISGTVNITGNDSNIYIPGNCYLYISGTFSGKVGIKTGRNEPERMANNVLKADDFAGLANLGCITNDYDGSRFGYHNGTNFAWTNNPEPATTADSGVYRTEEGGEELGVVRFITEFSAVDADAIESAGTYALNADTVKPSEIPVGTTFESFGSGFVAGANAYAVDVIKIAKSNFDKPVTAVSFVKIKSIDTPVYSIVSGAKVNTGKNLGINADSNFDAQEVTE